MTKYMTAAKANANTRQPIDIRAAGKPSKLDAESDEPDGNPGILFDPGRPPGASG